MLDILERQKRLTRNQWKIMVAAILGAKTPPLLPERQPALPG